MTLVKEFKIAAISSNTNSFGLHQLVAIAKDGEAFKACASSYNLPKRNGVIKVPYINDNEGNPTNRLNYSALGYEIPQKIDPAPKNVINELWNR